MKEELTLEQVHEDEMTWMEVIKYYFPDISDQYAEHILWNETCHPFDTKTTLKQIYEIYQRSTINV